MIDGSCYQNMSENAANPSQVCDPLMNQTDWSNRTSTYLSKKLNSNMIKRAEYEKI